MDLRLTVTTHWTQQTSADHFDFLDEEDEQVRTERPHRAPTHRKDDQ